VAQELKLRLERKFPGLKIAGTYTPPSPSAQSVEEAGLIQAISSVKPDIIWVGLSTPKQEKFMAQYWQKLDAT